MNALKSRTLLLTVLFLSSIGSSLPAQSQAVGNSSAFKGASSSAAEAAAQTKVANGPLLVERKLLFETIEQAASKGVGVGQYMQAFKSLESQVSAGASESQIHGRIEQLMHALADQSSRAKALKLQRPAVSTFLGSTNQGLPGSGRTVANVQTQQTQQQGAAIMQQQVKKIALLHRQHPEWFRTVGARTAKSKPQLKKIAFLRRQQPVWFRTLYAKTTQFKLLKQTPSRS